MYPKLSFCTTNILHGFQPYLYKMLWIWTSIHVNFKKIKHIEIIGQCNLIRFCYTQLKSNILLLYQLQNLKQFSVLHFRNHHPFAKPFFRFNFSIYSGKYTLKRNSSVLIILNKCFSLLEMLIINLVFNDYYNFKISN